MQYILTANGDFPSLIWCKQILNDDTGQYPFSSLDKSDYTYWIQIQRDKQEVGLCVWDRHVTQRSRGPEWRWADHLKTSWKELPTWKWVLFMPQICVF